MAKLIVITHTYDSFFDKNAERRWVSGYMLFNTLKNLQRDFRQRRQVRDEPGNRRFSTQS